MYVIITTNRPLEPNWSGKEWSELPCKIYSSFEDATDAINAYWLGGFAPADYHDGRKIVFSPLTEEKMRKLIEKKKARL